MAINYKSSKELQLLLLFLSCPKFLGCTSVYFWPVIIVCKGCQVIAGQSFTQRAQPLATDHWILTGVLPSPALCMSDPKQLGLGSTHFTFMASVYALIWVYCQSHSQASKAKLLRSSLGSSADNETGFVHWKSIPTLGALQRSALDINTIRPWGHNLAQKEKSVSEWFRALKSCC